MTKFMADKSFVDYITMIGFQFKETDSEKKYYVNSQGKQIRIDFELGNITLLNKFGNVEKSGKTFTLDQINSFAAKQFKKADVLS